MSGAASVQARLAMLREQYVLRLQEDLPRLRDAAQRLLAACQTPEWTALSEDVRNQLHKLAGSAGTFGFPLLSENSRALEQQIKPWAASAPSTPVVVAFVEQVRQLALMGISAERVMTEPDSLPEPVSDRSTAVVAASDGVRIYIADACSDHASELANALRNFGYTVSHFSAVNALREAIALQQPDALIINIRSVALPVVTDLRRVLPTGCPVIVLSDEGQFEQRLMAVKAGASGYFTFPLDIPRMERQLSQWLSHVRNTPYRVLIVDDDEELAERYRLVLMAARMDARVLSHPQAVLQELADFHPDVILLDVHMPSCSGPDLARVIRLDEDWLGTPIIYLSAEQNESEQVSALAMAGDEFITKPISDTALVAGVHARAHRARLLNEALHRDSLTGLLKHSGIKDHLATELARLERRIQPLSVAMIDIDHFKQVNDRYGHPMGDRVIRSLANLLRQRLRRTDGIGRYGGEEFLVVFPGCTKAEAARILEDVRQRFEALTFLSDGVPFAVSLSGGVTEAAPGRTLDDLVRYADLALYQAKAEGRNRIVQN